MNAAFDQSIWYDRKEHMCWPSWDEPSENDSWIAAQGGEAYLKRYVVPLGCVRRIKSRCRRDVEVYEYRNLWNQREKFRVTYENLRDEDGASDWYLTLVEPK